MDRAAHRLLVHKYLYDRGILIRYTESLERGTIDDTINPEALKCVIGREKEWVQHPAFYIFLKSYYDNIRRMVEGKSSQKPNARGVHSNVCPLNAAAAKHLQEVLSMVVSHAPQTKDSSVLSDANPISSDKVLGSIAPTTKTSVDSEENPTPSLCVIETSTNKGINKKETHQNIPQVNPDSSVDDIIMGFERSQAIAQIQAKPTLYVLKYAKSKNVCGEEANVLTTLFSILGGVHIMFVSPSGSGKTVVLDAVTSLVPDNWIYRMIASTNAAETRNFEEMNMARIGYILEAKNYLWEGNDNDHFKMMLCLTEGKDYIKRAASSSVDKETGERKVDKLVVRANKPFLTADAIESYLEIGEEMKRRFVELRTDTSEEHRKQVIQAVARKRSGISVGNEQMSSEVIDLLKSHVVVSMDMNSEGYICKPTSTAQQGRIQAVNYFCDTISAMIPTAMRATSYTEKLIDIMTGSMLLHHSDRLCAKSKMYVEMQDVYNVMTLYFPLMCKTMVGYPVFGDDIMSVIHEYISSVLSNSQATMSPSPDDSIDEQNKSMLNPEKKTVKHVYFTADDIYENLRKREGYSAVSIDTVQKILEELFKCKCLDKGKNDYRSKNPKYALVETLPFLDAKYDWQAGFEDAYVKMREDNPKLAETWRSKQIKEGFVVVYHPISGQEQRLFSINS